MRSILLLVVFAVVAQAKPGGGGVITDKDLKPYLEELDREFKKVRDRKLTGDEVLVYFRTRAMREKEPRVAAIRRYIHGRILMDGLNRPKDAKLEFETALKLFVQFPAALGRLAMLADKAGDTAHAIGLLKRALDDDPTYTDALNYWAAILARQKKYPKALKLLNESFEFDANVASCIKLSAIHVRLYHEAYVEKSKKKHADESELWAKRYKLLAPSDGNAYLVLAGVLAEVRSYARAVEVLEQAQIADIPSQAKFHALYQLYNLNARRNRLRAAVGALKRMLKHEQLEGKDRAEIEGKIKDLEENGGRAFLIWYVKSQIKGFENPGHDVSSRAAALRQLLRFYTDRKVIEMEKLADLRLEVLRVCIRALKNSPPEITILIFRFFQSFQSDPRLLRILVHFIYPADNDKRTPEVRTEAVRTIALLGQQAALPTLHYCLRDEPGMVLREVERQLTALCSIRSRVGEGVEPLTRRQAKLARKEWRKYFRGEAGSEKLIVALKELRRCVDMDPGFHQETKPMADHIAWTILMDDHMPYATWLAAYEFLRKYLEKEFRPVAKRGKAVTEKADRAPITESIREFFGGKDKKMPEVD